MVTLTHKKIRNLVTGYADPRSQQAREKWGFTRKIEINEAILFTFPSFWTFFAEATTHIITISITVAQKLAIVSHISHV